MVRSFPCDAYHRLKCITLCMNLDKDIKCDSIQNHSYAKTLHTYRAVFRSQHLLLLYMCTHHQTPQHSRETRQCSTSSHHGDHTHVAPVPRALLSLTLVIRAPETPCHERGDGDLVKVYVHFWARGISSYVRFSLKYGTFLGSHGFSTLIPSLKVKIYESSSANLGKFVQIVCVLHFYQGSALARKMTFAS